METTGYVLARVNKNKIKIPLGLNRPILDSHNLEKWNKLEAEFAKGLKEKLERGEISVTDFDDEMVKWSNMQIREMEKKRRKINIYEQTEKKLNKLNEEIQTALKQDKKKCIKLLKELQELELNPIILKKNPSIVDTILKANEFQYDRPGLITRRRMADFKESVEEMKRQVHKIISTFGKIFNIPDNNSFFEFFMKEKELFIQKTKNMPAEDIYDLLS